MIFAIIALSIISIALGIALVMLYRKSCLHIADLEKDLSEYHILCIEANGKRAELANELYETKNKLKKTERELHEAQDKIPVLRVETFHNPVMEIKHNVEIYPEDFPTCSSEELSKMAKSFIKKEMSKDIEEFIEYTNEFDPYLRQRRWYGRLKVIKPEQRSDYDIQEGEYANWIYIKDTGLCQCSNCGHLHAAMDIDAYKYCPNCGSQMVEKKEGE